MSDVVNLSRFRSSVARALARRGKKLLETNDPAAEMAALETLEAYYIVKEMGVDNAVTLLRHADDEKFLAFIDLDCWRGDRPDAEEIDAWLAPFAAAGEEELWETFLRLDSELQVLFLAQSLIVYDNREEENLPSPPRGARRKQTVDTFFTIETLPEAEREVDPFVLVDALYAHDVSVAFALLQAVRWELEDPLAEEAYRFRAGRLEDLGFPSVDRAMLLFSKPPLKPSAPVDFSGGASTPHTLPALYAEPLGGDSLLARAMARITDEKLLAGLEESLRYLCNAAIIAYGDSPNDIRRAAAIATRVRDTLCLGLEHLLSPEAPHAFPDGDGISADAATLLQTWPLSDIFRIAYGEVMQLARDAARLAEDPPVAQWLERSETEADDYSEDRRDREFIKALCSSRPLHGGYDVGDPTKRKAFADKRELAAAVERLDTIAARLI